MLVCCRFFAHPGIVKPSDSVRLALYPFLQRFPALATRANGLIDLGLAAWTIDPSSPAATESEDALEASNPMQRLQAQFGIKSPPLPEPASSSSSEGGAVGSASLLRRLLLMMAGYFRLKADLARLGLLFAFAHQETQLLPLLARMEVVGFGYDVRTQAAGAARLQKRLGELQQRAHDLAGHPFNVASAKECSVVLYDELGLQVEEEAGAYRAGGPKKKLHKSTNERMLTKLSSQHELPRTILAFRRVFKLLNTFTTPLNDISVKDRSNPVLMEVQPRLAPAGQPASPPQSVAQQPSSAARRRVHARFMQTATATGRLSSRSPNMQNLPGAEEKRRHAGEDAVAAGVNVRAAFRAVGEHRTLLAADFASIEIRVLAHLCGRSKLAALFVQAHQEAQGAASQQHSQQPAASQHGRSASKADLYRYLASVTFGVPPADVSTSQRSQAKTVVLGVVYGMGTRDMAVKLGVSDTHASQLRNQLLARFPGIKRFTAAAVSFARTFGYVPTLTGRRRPLPAISAEHSGARSQAERQATNTVVQGTAADLIKAAMVVLSFAIAEAQRRAFGPALGCEVLQRVERPAGASTPSQIDLSQTQEQAQEELKALSSQQRSGSSGGAGLSPPARLRSLVSQLLASLSPPHLAALARSQLLLQVHDELVLEVPTTPEGAVVAVGEVVRQCMEGAAPIYLGTVASALFIDPPRRPHMPESEVIRDRQRRARQKQLLGGRPFLQVPLSVSLSTGPSFGELAPLDA